MTREKMLHHRIRNGDQKAFNELIDLYYQEIFRYCIWHTPSRSSAEDATQDTFLKAVNYYDRYMNYGKFRAFLYKIAANTCKDIWRKKSLMDLSLENTKQEFPYMEGGYQAAESELALHQAVRELPEELREAVLLRYGQELTIKETAEVMNLPLRTVQSRIRRALGILKTSYGKGGNGYEA